MIFYVVFVFFPYFVGFGRKEVNSINLGLKHINCCKIADHLTLLHYCSHNSWFKTRIKARSRALERGLKEEQIIKQNLKQIRFARVTYQGGSSDFAR
jgi:hypothetical protein